MPPKGTKRAGKKETTDGGASFRRLKNDIKAGTLGNLYLFKGEESYLRDHYLKAMKQKLLTGMEEFNLHTMAGKDFDLKKLQELVDCLPMMSQRTLIVVNDYDIYKGDREGMMKVLSDLPDYVCLVFVYDLIGYKADGRTKLATLIQEKGQVVSFDRQGQDDLVAWIARHFRAMDHDISSDDAKYLMFLCGDLMNVLNSEIGKIGAYAKGRRVTREDIDAVATPQLDAIVFQMTDAIGEGDFDRAASVLGDLFQMQEIPIKILAALSKNLRQLYAARLLLERRKGISDLMGLWKIKNYYPAQKLMGSAKRFSLEWCRRAVIRCAETDLAMKSNGADAERLLVTLLMELAVPKRS
ncbi:DNA polymerase III subunit delta [Pseudoflavonifractor sp. MSJ-37]|uniref:DNA polymerase III subunit delta n=1 Tax=Pseudoflavonifractor sp. MSJ-37 TaxID=2841531 RepID=UPI001C125012|nr:DNA polymerase III subunit delta [Pseudoflavonifractor sp. MSJ-37]MBU5435709.1 DNA polymerase III subunit delta [Pseudoflavonifractor sp. MSJ-37]